MNNLSASTNNIINEKNRAEIYGVEIIKKLSKELT